MRKALALIAYDRPDYAKQVLASIYQQRIASASLFDLYDVYLFQDGLKDHDQQNPVVMAEHARVWDLCEQAQSVKKVYRQQNNLGVARHFDFVEKTLFVDEDYDFVVFCEDDMILSPAYMNTIDQMANLFENDPRIAMVSAHSQAYAHSKERQMTHENEYLTMGHHWGFGMYRRAWKDIYPLINDYLGLLGESSYSQRNHRVIQYWQQQCGFRVGATSQDYLKACALAALGYLRISTYPNYGFYIGARGEHFYPEAYAKQNYDKTVVCEQSPQGLNGMTDAVYAKLMQEQARSCLIDPWDSQRPKLFRGQLMAGALRPAVPPNLWDLKLTAEDVIAAYKIFFNRLPESREVVECWLGKEPSLLLRAIVSSQEFKELLSGRGS